nr:hypothetical protein [Enterocloster clostridioformis]
MYTANIIEGLNYQYRKVIKNQKRIFGNAALEKMRISSKWKYKKEVEPEIPWL